MRRKEGCVQEQHHRLGGAPALAWPTTLAWRWRSSFACRHLLGKWTRKLLFSSSDHEELKMCRLQKNWHLICCVLWAVISVLATIPITATENPNPLSTSITADSSQGNLLKGVDNLSGADWILGERSKKVLPFWTTSCVQKPKAIIAGVTENLVARIFLIHFSIDNFIANISLYALSCSKLNFGYCLTFKINFPSFKTSLFDANSKSNRLSNPFPGNFCYCFYF